MSLPCPALVRRWLLLWLCLSPLAGAAPPLCVTDDGGERLCLERPARRVVALAPHAIELLQAAGAGAALVGCSSGIPTPPGCRVVGGYPGLSLEAVLALRPDLVVAWPSGNPPRLLARLVALGLPVYRSDPRGVAGIAENLRELGRLLGHAEQGERAAAELQRRWADLRARWRGRRPVRTLLLISSRPLMSLSADHPVQAAFDACGAVNPVGHTATLAPRLGREGLLRLRPELILSTRPLAELRPLLDGLGLTDVPVRHFAADGLLRPSPAFVDGVARFCAAVDAARRVRDGGE